MIRPRVPDAAAVADTDADAAGTTTPRRRGRRPSDVDVRVRGGIHLLLLSVLRDRYQRDGHTLDELSETCSFVRSKISELLRGYGGKYPRWEITKAVAEAMELPCAPMCRLWLAGAREACKKEKWIKGNQGAYADGQAPLPRVLEGLLALHGETYRGYAGVFLRPEDAEEAVDQALSVVWARMDAVFAGPSAAGEVWQVLRERVMACADATAHAVAAFRTVSVRQGGDVRDASSLPDLSRVPRRTGPGDPPYAPRLPGAAGPSEPGRPPADPFARLTEQMALYRAIRDLQPHHADVLILRHVLGRSAAKTADVLGTDTGMVGLWEQQALTELEQGPQLRTTMGGMAT